MKHIQTSRARRRMFEPLHHTRSMQAAMMTLKPGEETGEPQNEHPRAEQWLLVLSGKGVARVSKHKLNLRQGSLLLIEKGEIHQIRNNGKTPLVTINFYAPPAYTAAGNVRLTVKARRSWMRFLGAA